MQSLFLLLTLVFGATGFSDNVPQEKIDEAMKALVVLASDPKLIELVQLQNTQPPAQFATEVATMTNEKWTKLSTRDPLVKSLTQNEAAKTLRARVASYVSEAFLSAKNGTKVAFLSKTSSWNHAGKAKHDVPMKGKTWQGAVELDQSSGVNQIQISAPVLFQNNPIGSLVIGIAVVKLK